MVRRRRVVVAMSGGVDSAVAAGLLVRAGYEVVGITMRLWTLEDPDAPVGKKRCCSVEDTDDARAAADALGIPHYVLNMERQFHDRVIDYFVAEYGRGRTPNPCLACNEHVKFRALLDRAVALDADLLATGHYARIDRAPDGRYRLLRAIDPAKDQSYVLYTMGQPELAKTLFPVGGYDKPQIRALAREMRLPLAEKPDSADICFVPDGDYAAFVRKRLPQEPGVVRDHDGTVVGGHDGIAGFTIGQRRGLGVAVGERRFVTQIDPALNAITIGPEDGLMAGALVAESVNWLAGPPPAVLRADAKIRYRTPAAPATVAPLPGRTANVVFDRPQRAITPGQAVVFYDGDEVLGGGAILRAIQSAPGLD
ncbi:MAG TPA: tRNA 2-thiouridine(34) synthase MnmA [Dehalococcoidia bacterium]|nr:tRNA 2-thiouridine(34) synthase MnmA [Dehalococcoidia bacterium]